MIAGALLVLAAGVLTVLSVVLWRRIFAKSEIPPERGSQGAQPPGITAPAAADTQECRLAVHEAGHAVAGWCCTLVGEVSVATIEDKDGGLVKHTFYAVPGPAALWCEMVISLAGVAAEAMVYSRWRTKGSERDLARALGYAEQIGAAGQAGLPWDKLSPGGKVPDFGKMYGARPSPEALENLGEGYRMTRKVLRSHGSGFFKMVSLLLTKRAVTNFDMERVLGKRRFETLIAVGARIESVVNESGRPELFKPRFVLPLRRRKAG